MHEKKLPGLADMVSDDAPELTVDMLDDAEVFDGDRFVRRGRGRPPSDSHKEKINIRLDAAVLERLRASGPGWQSRVNRGLALLTGADARLWNWMEHQIETYTNRIEHLQGVVVRMETGVVRSFTNDQDTTEESLRFHRDEVEHLSVAIKAMRETQAWLFLTASGL